ncbi:tail protein X [uncultured Tateyamaria sp.]|uniref:tail protein X n=1 Tax=uncultured Tateyamaria sp. TaxID=455651 RepID=UPI002624A27D|nr:tail protein X [uncultured Tateyamaria sp.]
MLDQVIAAHYGDTNGGKVDAVLAANPGLAGLGVVLEPGVRILLPDLSEAQPAETEQLWG